MGRHKLTYNHSELFGDMNLNQPQKTETLQVSLKPKKNKFSLLLFLLTK